MREDRKLGFHPITRVPQLSSPTAVDLSAVSLGGDEEGRDQVGTHTHIHTCRHTHTHIHWTRRGEIRSVMDEEGRDQVGTHAHTHADTHMQVN